MTETLRVLLVDDSDVDVAVITDNLIAGTREPVSCERATTGHEALAALTSRAFDVCLLDHRLGCESGIDVLRQLRRRGLDLPVIVLTAATDHEVDVAASDAGADDYLDKVRLTPELLERAIRYARRHRRLTGELRAQNREKNLLLGMAAHDLRNPIGVVRGYAEFLAESLGEVDPAEAKQILETMRNSCAQMNALIDDLLDVSAIEAGTLVLKTQGSDLATLARASIARHATLAATKAITIELVAAPLPSVSIDRDRFDQVLANLIGNALKYSNRGTRVTVRIDREGERALVSVEDHGIGIEASFLPRMFEPFQRARRTGTSGEKSNGLGLAIVRRIVQAHGGTIRVASVVGEGSTFTVSLPLAPAP